MDFSKLKQPLLDNYDNTIEVYKILKSGLGVNNIDFFYFDSNKGIFFDRINTLVLNIKYLDKNSILGNSILDKEPYCIEDIKIDERYNSAIDNPFNMDIDRQIIIPIFLKSGKIKGIIRLSEFPISFSQIDFRNLKVLRSVFLKILSTNNIYNREEIDIEKQSQERLKNYNNISQIRKLYNLLIENKTNPELEKLINIGRDNLDDIYQYLNPNIENTEKINEEIEKIVNSSSTDIKEKKINILIADDIRINVQILNAMLSKYKNIGSVKFAYDGMEALEILDEDRCKNSIHILFLDHHMPGALGSDIAKELKGDKYKDNDITIVSITNDKDVLAQNKDLYDHHIPKPFTQDNIKRIMDKIDE
jgi:CheY-like chemotaxis protein